MIDGLGPGRVQWLHVTLFAVSVLTTAKALFSSVAAWFWIPGTCWICTACSIWIGLKVTLSQSAGRLWWKSRGPARLISMHLRAFLCLITGLGLTARALLCLHPIECAQWISLASSSIRSSAA